MFSVALSREEKKKEGETRTGREREREGGRDKAVNRDCTAADAS